MFGLLDKRIGRQGQRRRLAADVQLGLQSVSKVHAVRNVPNQGAPFPPGFDYGYRDCREFPSQIHSYQRSQCRG
jgi:hypothetical protein